MKRCVKCGEDKPNSDFHKQAAAKDGLKTWCKRCACSYTNQWHADNADKRAAWVRRRKQDPAVYRAANWRSQGIDVAQAATMLREHDGRCTLCGADFPGTKKGWAVDHCHATGKVRGVLCYGCNTGLGGFKDNPHTLRKAAEYIERSRP